MENPKTAIAERIKESANVLVTVSANPSVDQLAAAIGLTLVLNKLDKHATAVFSGDIPSTIEFLQPEKTLEKTTDSLRDFIIALDKSKADKLRYKVEDKLVKIFITPYRTSLSERDLEFSQGDFNVDLVLAVGVHRREDLDQAITAHGRILHDATVVSINTQAAGDLGSVNWIENNASSLCEMVTGLSELIKTGLMDAQIATALLTGIVAETERFSNSKTTSETMAMSSKLMAAGANQQLVATKLQEQLKPPSSKKPSDEEKTNKATKPAQDGSLDIAHEESASPVDQIHIDEHGTLHLGDESNPLASAESKSEESRAEPPSANEDSRSVITKPPTLGGKLTANSEPEGLEPSVDPLSLPAVDTPLLRHDVEPWKNPSSPDPSLPTMPLPQPPAPKFQVTDNKPTELPTPPTLPDLPQPAAAVDSSPKPSVEEARKVVEQATAGIDQPLQPIASLSAQPMDLNLGHNEPSPSSEPALPQPPLSDADVSSDPGLPPNLTFQTPTLPAQQDPGSLNLRHSLIPPDPGLPADNTAAPSASASPPPPVPPPMMPPTFGTPTEDDTQSGNIPGVAL